MRVGIDSASIDDVLSALRNEHRRLLCDHMTTATKRRFDVDELAAMVARQQEKSGEDDRPDGRREEIVTTLQHRDLPRLDDAGLIDFDAADGTVRWLDGNSASFVETVLAELEGGKEGVGP